MTTQRPFARYLEPEITGARFERQWVRTRNRIAAVRSRAHSMRRATLAAFVACVVLLLVVALTSSGVNATTP